MTSLLLILFLLCLALSFFLSGMEAGVFALSRLRIRRLMRAGNTPAKVLHRFLEDPEDFLWAILVGNTAANFIIATLSIIFFQRWLRTHLVLFTVCFVVGALLFWGTCELLPKIIFRLYPNRLCLALARPFRMVHWLLQPLVAVVRWLASGLMHWSGGKTFTGHLFGNREELRRLMQDSAHEFSTEERSMIERVLDLQALRIGNVMVTMPKVVDVPAETTVREAIGVCRERGLSRLPVWKEQGASRRIIGLFNLRSLLYSTVLQIEESRRVDDYLQPATFLDVDMRLEDAMRHLQRTGQRLAIVLSRDRREIGIVSLQDILKAIFGQVRL